MGSATREALAGTRDALTALGRRRPAGRRGPPRRGPRDQSARRSSCARHSSTTRPMPRRSVRWSRRSSAARISADAATLLASAASSRWSSGADFLAGIEDLGIRVAADRHRRRCRHRRRALRRPAHRRIRRRDSNSRSVQQARLVRSRRRCSSTGSSRARRRRQTVAIVRHLVQQPRGRRIGEMLRHAASVVADQRGFDIAMVTTAVPLSDAQLARLERGLAAQYGRPPHPIQHDRRSRRASAGFACRSATTSSTAASPAASAR